MFFWGGGDWRNDIWENYIGKTVMRNKYIFWVGHFYSNNLYIVYTSCVYLNHTM